MVQPTPQADFLKASREVLLHLAGGVRLQGIYTPQPAGRAKGLVLFLHGWLGSAQSNYAVRIGDFLFQQGFSFFRLNFRDHGGTHGLNQAVFRADRLAEIFEAAQQIAEFEADRPFHLVGASMGGNFALRLAWQHSQSPIPNLGHTVAICPVIDGYQATLAIDRQPLYLPYFRRKWRAMLAQKKEVFPELANFSEAVSARSCLAMTEAFVRQHSPYPDAISYFASYAVKPAMMMTLRTPVTIIAAADDPIIPAADFEPFSGLDGLLHLAVQRYGGHVGFVDIAPFRLWIEQAILTVLADHRRLV